MQGNGERERRLERQADRLIAESIRRHGRGEYPCYQERWMDQLSRRERPGVERVAGSVGPGEIEARLGGMVVDAQLTRRQRMVIRWIVRGISQRE
ncbi:MAG: hypothetical protein ACP5KN_09900, partial [Armatimonadota bacterium]